MGGQYIEPVSSLLEPVRSALARCPGCCAVCAAWTPGRLCLECLRSYVREVPRCPLCAETLPLGGAPCLRCRIETLPLDATIAAVDYGFPWSGLIARMKYHGADDLAGTFAAVLQAAVAQAPTPPVQWIVPIPLALERQRERGFNPAWELARRLRRDGARHDPAALERLVDTPHQTGLDRSGRQANLRGAFRVAPRAAARLQGRHVALVDDVMTSGATLAEAARTLRQAGVASVQGWVFARTPRSR